MSIFCCSSKTKDIDYRNWKDSDTVIVSINCQMDSLIELQLINLRNDTLILLPNPFFIESTLLTKNYPWVMWASRFSTPNIIYVEKDLYKSRYSTDAIYEPDFQKMPVILKFNPADTIRFKITLPTQIVKNIDCDNYYVGGAIVYGTKSNADSIGLESDKIVLTNSSK